MSASPAFDAVSLGILWDRLIAITDEGVSTLVRTAFSTVVREGYDLSVVLLDADGALLAQGTQSIPSFTGSAPATLRHMLNRFPPAELRPGDVVVTNDPWMGSGHLYDINVMRPMFRQGRIVAYVLSITHLPDIGGSGFGSEAAELWQEGLRLPVAKLVVAGRRDEFLMELIATNVRVPEQVIGDVLANVACTAVAERQLLDLMAEYGLADLGPLSHQIQAASEAAMRARILAMRPGTWRAELMIEGIDQPIRLACTATLAEGAVALDFAGSQDCVPFGVNVPFCFTNGYAIYAVKCLAGAPIPNNAGATRSIAVTAPAGCILHALPPAATAARHSVGWFIVPLVFRALAAAALDAVPAESGMINMVNFRGTHRDGRAITTLHFASGGCGALRGLDGLPTISTPSSNAGIPVEVWEAETSLTVTEKRLLTDSGGAGAFRGGLGQRLSMRNDTGAALIVDVMGYRTDYPAAGAAGGRAGQARQMLINDRLLPHKGRFVLAPGDRLTRIEAGGGGYGAPGARDPQRLAADVAAGYVSAEAAERDYRAPPAKVRGA
ncbi:MAG: hydantoinase B/oxoprolinase family protein [Alphaproteobacteria bacterium]|nr:hydantoinase B/oxoprolinase family protein [Alphaproteobacteria bacterium]